MVRLACTASLGLLVAAGCGLSERLDPVMPPLPDAGSGTGATDSGVDAGMDAARERVDADLDASSVDRPRDATLEQDANLPDAWVIPMFDATMVGPDAGAPREAAVSYDASATDAGFCAGMMDGIVCSPDSAMTRLICRRGMCVRSFCGDGYVDSAAHEQCEDGNDIAGDGCEPITCQHTCNPTSPSTTCMPADGCAMLSCSSLTYQCVYSPLPDRSACTLGAATGICLSGTCVPGHCGDMVVQPSAGEECDNGTAANTAGSGCDPNCRFSCHSIDDCSDGNACDGIETCDTGTHTCSTFLAACDPSSICSAVSCDPAVGCVNQPIDVDGDGYGPVSLGSTCGNDCNDMDPSVHPGAVEQCDGVDHDCDLRIDEDTGATLWYRDADRDGSGDSATTTTACSQPAGYVSNSADCYDSATDPLAALVHPGQMGWFTAPYYRVPSSPSYDYNCSHAQEQEFTALQRCGLVSLSACSNGSGWEGSTVPSCGSIGTFLACGPGTIICGQSHGPRPQPCH